jgi:hypothetical protein
VQGLYWFELNPPEYDTDSTFGFVTNPDGSHPLSKWTQAVPQTIGQFPASALLYRLGYVKAGQTVVHEERTRAMLNAREIPLIAEDPSFDPNHNGSDSRAGSSQASGIDPLAFLVGPVEEKFDGDPSATAIKNVAPYIDRDGKTVKSITGELMLDYGNGIFRVNAPKAQAVAGFLSKSGGAIKLQDVTFECSDPYAVITVVPLDDAPIATSGKLLVQIGTVDRLSGWKQEPATHASPDGKTTLQGWTVVSPGKMPWRQARLHATLTVANAKISRATVLDAGGYPVGQIPVKSLGGRARVVLPEDAMYVILG